MGPNFVEFLAAARWGGKPSGPLLRSSGRETQTPLCYVRVAVIALRLLFVFRSLCAVFGTGLLSVGYAGSIKSTSDDVVSGTRKVLYTAAADQNNRVLLKVVALTREDRKSTRLNSSHH